MVRVRVRVVDAEGKELCASRDLEEIQAALDTAAALGMAAAFGCSGGVAAPADGLGKFTEPRKCRRTGRVAEQDLVPEPAIAFAGADHILAGSDYPHQVGSIELMKSSLASLDLSAEDNAGIHENNAARLLGLLTPNS